MWRNSHVVEGPKALSQNFSEACQYMMRLLVLDVRHIGER